MDLCAGRLLQRNITASTVRRVRPLRALEYIKGLDSNPIPTLQVYSSSAMQISTIPYRNNEIRVFQFFPLYELH